MSEGYLIQRSKQEFMQVNKTLFLEKRLGAFINPIALRKAKIAILALMSAIGLKQGHLLV